ncbi:DnaJ domain-containing protein [Pontibacter sp. SGAir0037]|uniref:J domain-containing protein n=1 Tax=Pontibacter sp. SGAir0037 TaxID=2571030 RepID=UPI0010CD6A90|nr:DnaJ domain-containing protein [Pontibacter sp. SGAir0037]QCR24064.1 molecular chaperone DnaJ [Pontibacter sp. SGAir0037]
MEKNFYTILGVSQQASQQDIKQAYKKLAVQYHPDKNPGNLYAEEQFKLVNAAYQTLSDPTKRARYDLRLLYLSEQQQVMQQQQPYYNPRYRQTRPPAPVSERYYRTMPKREERRFVRKDLYITLGFMAFMLIFSLLLKATMDHITGEDKYKTALSYIADGKYSSAHSMLTETIHFKPKHAEAYRVRAGIEMDVYENYVAAVKDLNQVVSLEETAQAETYYMRGKCYLKLSQFRLAEQDLTQALSLDSTLFAAYLERGETRLFHLQQYNKAIADFNAFLRHSAGGERWATALTFRGFGFYKKGNYRQSAADYKQVLEADATNGRVYYLLARTEQAQHQTEAACHHLREAYRLGYSAAILELKASCK